jgi:two-component sensor histidine kinase
MSLADMRTAPSEFRRLGREMKRMAFAIQERDRNLSKALERQFAMTREIHHRVKNNLQIVSSLIAIYAQSVSNPVARSAFRQIIARVDALTLIEKSDTEPTIDLDLLFEQLADQVRALALESNLRLQLTLTIAHRWLPPDIATPLVLFTLEALTYDIFLPRPDLRRRKTHLTFGRDETGYVLTIDDESPGALPSGASLSDRVMRSLTEQLRGRMTSEPLQRGTRLILRVPLDISLVPEPPLPQSPENVYDLDAARSRQA